MIAVDGAALLSVLVLDIVWHDIASSLDQTASSFAGRDLAEIASLTNHRFQLITAIVMCQGRRGFEARVPYLTMLHGAISPRPDRTKKSDAGRRLLPIEEAQPTCENSFPSELSGRRITRARELEWPIPGEDAHVPAMHRRGFRPVVSVVHPDQMSLVGSVRSDSFGSDMDERCIVREMIKLNSMILLTLRGEPRVSES
jgi:hypothetical protein